MKQFFKILALAALALPFTGCDVEYSDINILPDPVFEQNGLYTVNTISIYDDYETVINVSRTAGLSKELELDIVVDETLLAEYNELYNTDYNCWKHSSTTFRRMRNLQVRSSPSIFPCGYIPKP